MTSSESTPSAGSSGGAAILDDLQARGLLARTTDADALRARLDEGPITLYCGFDPTAPSLHLGNLFPLLLLRRFQLFGHRPIVLAGGATGMIGDPGGRSDERNLLDDDALDANLAGILPQLEQFLDFDGPAAARLVDNRSWTANLSAIDFLRDVGKLVTVNQMVARDSVRTRMEGEHGISYTEFSYMLLQGNDYVELAQNADCELQVGGADQWGNIVLGVGMVRRRLGRTVHALTTPLLLRPDGAKYGKSAGGDTLWLSPELMSPYRFHQALLQSTDEEIPDLLNRLTFLPVDDIAAIMADHTQNPGARAAQRAFADAMTDLVHGEAATEAATEAASLLFTKASATHGLEVSERAFEQLSQELETSTVTAAALDAGITPEDLAVGSGIVASKSEARRLISGGGLSVNGRPLEADSITTTTSLAHGRYLLLRKGKKTHRLIIRSAD